MAQANSHNVKLAIRSRSSAFGPWVDPLMTVHHAFVSSSALWQPQLLLTDTSSTSILLRLSMKTFQQHSRWHAEVLAADGGAMER